MNVLFVVAAYAGIFVAGEYTYRARHLRPETARRYVHLGSGLLAMFLPLWLSREEIIGLALLFIALLFFSKRRMLLPSVHATQRTTWGEVFFPAGVGLAAVLYLPHDAKFYFLSLLILSVSDPLANWLGSNFRSPHLLYEKTCAGSLAFFLSSLLIALLLLEPGQAVLVAVCATVGEAIGPYGSDNCMIVPAVGFPLLFM